MAQTGEAGEAAALDGKVLGKDPETGKDVTLRNGRFGAYVQLGDAELAPDQDEPKPKSKAKKPPKPNMIQPKRSKKERSGGASSVKIGEDMARNDTLNSLGES